MPKKQPPRKKLSRPLSRSLLNANAGVCCVCKRRGLGVQIHHIDLDHTNDVATNLAVLCVQHHDAYHRPPAYPVFNHLDLGADAIRENKQQWERAVAEARSDAPQLVAIVAGFGSEDRVDGVRLTVQWTNGEIVLERDYQPQTDGTIVIGPMPSSMR